MSRRDCTGGCLSQRTPWVQVSVYTQRRLGLELGIRAHLVGTWPTISCSACNSSSNCCYSIIFIHIIIIAFYTFPLHMRVFPAVIRLVIVWQVEPQAMIMWGLRVRMAIATGAVEGVKVTPLGTNDAVLAKQRHCCVDPSYFTFVRCCLLSPLSGCQGPNTHVSVLSSPYLFLLSSVAAWFISWTDWLLY